MHAWKTRDNGCKLKRDIQTGYKEKPFPHEDSQAVDQVVQKGYAVSTLGHFPHQLDKALSNVVSVHN